MNNFDHHVLAANRYVNHESETERNFISPRFGSLVIEWKIQMKTIDKFMLLMTIAITVGAFIYVIPLTDKEWAENAGFLGAVFGFVLSIDPLIIFVDGLICCVVVGYSIFSSSKINDTHSKEWLFYLIWAIIGVILGWIQGNDMIFHSRLIRAMKLPFSAFYVIAFSAWIFHSLSGIALIKNQLPPMLNYYRKGLMSFYCAFILVSLAIWMIDLNHNSNIGF